MNLMPHEQSQIHWQYSMWQRANEPSIIEQTAAFTFNNLTLFDHISTHKSSVILYCSCTCMCPYTLYLLVNTIFKTNQPSARMHCRGNYSSFVCVCACVCVCLSVTTLTATYHVYTSQVRCHAQGCLWRFQDFIHVAFAENALFESSGEIFRPPLPSWLLDDDDQLSMNKRDRLVYRDTDNSYNMTDWSLIFLKQPLSLKASWFSSLCIC